jgi:hypothetical protein
MALHRLEEALHAPDRNKLLESLDKSGRRRTRRTNRRERPKR